jgi:hypothetical protein
LGSSSTTVTAAMTASSVSPPFFRMSIPLSRACRPFVLEMISGRLLDGGTTPAGGMAALAGDAPARSLPTPATALDASEVRKNLRRDQISIDDPPGTQISGATIAAGKRRSRQEDRRLLVGRLVPTTERQGFALRVCREGRRMLRPYVGLAERPTRRGFLCGCGCACWRCRGWPTICARRWRRCPAARQ